MAESPRLRHGDATGEPELSAVSIEEETSQWRSRAVRYFSGDWPAIQSVLPEFELKPFTAGDGEPSNPFLQTVVRRPMSTVERAVPVGVVGKSYSLVQHQKIAEICRTDVLEKTDCLPAELRYEVGLSELGEWMNFRICFPNRYYFRDKRNENLDLRLECFNSVDGSCRLVILFGWFRFVCSNGLVIGETKIDIRERHGRDLDLAAVSDRLSNVFNYVEYDRVSMEKFQHQPVRIDQIAAWCDGKVSQRWGKKAATRVYHICDSGKDVELADPFAPGEATEKPVRYICEVPGAPSFAATKYDVLQALSYVATRRKDAEERVRWQANIPSLLDRLPRHTPVEAHASLGAN